MGPSIYDPGNIVNLKIVEHQPNCRAIKYRSGRDYTLINYYLSFPYMQYYVISGNNLDYYMSRIFFVTCSLEPFSPKTQFYRVLLPNVYEDNSVCMFTGGNVKEMFEKFADIDYAISHFWNSEFIDDELWGRLDTVNKMELDGPKGRVVNSIHTWDYYTHMFGNFVTKANWNYMPQTFIPFEENIFPDTRLVDAR